MTTRSSSPRPDDSLISPAPAGTGVPTPYPQLLGWPAPAPEQLPGVLHPEDPLPGDPLHQLVHAAVADRPVEDVAQLITLLERSPEHARTAADALRAAGVDRSVEDVTRLVALLTEPSRESDSADQVIRAAAERRSLEDVTLLMQLLHRNPVERRCGQAAVRAAAVSRPVEELAELISRLAAERTRQESPLPEPLAPEQTRHLPTFAVAAAAAVPAPQEADAPPRPAEPGAEQPRPAKSLTVTVRSLRHRPARDRAPRDRAASGSPDDRTIPAPLWTARGAALLVFLCGVAHAPRYWTGLSQGVLGSTIVVAALCMLLALTLPARAAQARLVAATAAVGVTAVLAVGQLLAGRFGPRGISRLWDGTLAPSWLAGTAAAAAALAALAVLAAALTTGGAESDGSR
ncbi:hypothetical protein SAMN05428944_1059 [Streptomyces sp. 1222.5]|uniref:hypothetical protein n=1 Tax=unclassified Streptomyces TaxID=2593676 RepID=UPI00089CF915|nr:MULTISPECIES: hypothetical protein [unclassified Streptomyces]PKW11719.1 hypothetical protein BX260_7037 [Streptomyces sp. 5112.2]SEB71678.1 hypothetical protein SAMN05428944_1059 [Streptomyces sp. 1222.5]